MTSSLTSTDEETSQIRESIPRRTRWLPRLVAALAVLPVVAMLAEVARAGRLQHIDYLFHLVRITNRDGTLKPFSLENYFSNEHLLGLPTLVYWLNIKLFSGDNRTLGVYVVVVAALLVALLAHALPRTTLPTLLPRSVLAALVVAASLLVFGLHGLWNYTRAMSGTAWITANLIITGALFLGHRGRWWWAWALALLGCLTYGTALVVWPVLALLAFLRRDAWWQRIVPLAVGTVVIAVWLAYRPSAPLADEPTSDLGSLLYYFLTVVGKLWTTDSGGMAAVAGAVVLCLYVALACNPITWERELWFWWALALHAVLCAGMIATARVDYGGEVGMTTARYTSISVLLAIPALVLLAVVLYRRLDSRGHLVAALAVAAGLLGYALGAPGAVLEREANKAHHTEAVAVRGGFSDAYRRYPLAAELVPRLRALHHYPFTDDFTLGCGGPELGSRLSLADMEPLPRARGNKRPRNASGAVTQVEPVDPAPFYDGRAVPIFHGWAADRDDPVRCVVLVDGAGTVVGGGVTGLSSPAAAQEYAGVAGDSGFRVIGPVDEDSRIVVIHRSGAMHWLPPELLPAPTGVPGSREASG